MRRWIGVGVLLSEIGVVISELLLCLTVLFVPFLLAMFTAEFARQRHSFQDASHLIWLNFLLALSIASIAVNEHLSTLTAMAIAGYILVFVGITGIITGLLVLKVWRYIAGKVRLLRMESLDDETSELQSLLQY